jgi:hypothetical protein
MYARIATFEGADVERTDEAIETNRREIEAALESPPEGLEGVVAVAPFGSRSGACCHHDRERHQVAVRTDGGSGTNRLRGNRSPYSSGTHSASRRGTGGAGSTGRQRSVDLLHEQHTLYPQIRSHRGLLRSHDLPFTGQPRSRQAALCHRRALSGGPCFHRCARYRGRGHRPQKARTRRGFRSRSRLRLRATGAWLAHVR